MARRIISLLTIGAIGGGSALVANADPKPTQVALAPKVVKPPKPPVVIKPRVLPMGAPACGNVMNKSYSAVAENPICPTIRNLRELEESGRNFQKDIELHQVGGVALTLGVATRPRL